MFIEGKSHGPHAFFINLRKGQGGTLTDGITVGDMGSKTVGNDLDNAWVGQPVVFICYNCLCNVFFVRQINFDNVIVPKSTLLNKYADIEEVDGNIQYIQKVKSLPIFHMIGQRLFTGRVAVCVRLILTQFLSDVSLM